MDTPVEETSFNSGDMLIGSPLSTSSSRTSIEVFNIEEPHKDDRMRTRVLDYMRHNYFRIIKIGLFVLLALVIIIVGLVIYVVFAPSQKLVYITSLPNSNFTPNVADVISASTLSDTQPVFETSPEPMITRRTYCQKLRCDKVDYCKPNYVAYATLRPYACCCLPSNREFKYFEYDKISMNAKMCLRPLDVDPKTWTKYDINLLPPLSNLDGAWQIIQSSDVVYLLCYTSIQIPVPVAPDEVNP